MHTQSTILTVDPDEDNMRLDRWIKLHFPQITQGQLQKSLRKKDIRVNDKKTTANQRLQPGQQISLSAFFMQLTTTNTSAPPSNNTPPPKTLITLLKASILYQDDNLLVLNKPAGLPVQGGSKVKHSIDSVLEYLVENDTKPKLVHRIDKDTSGILLLAKNRQTATMLTQLFKDKQIEKTYLALIKGNIPQKEGVIDIPICKKLSGNKERMQVDEAEGQKAITHYKTIDQAGKIASLVELQPITGRTHQLRIHMMEMQTPIIGDGKYAGKEAFIDGLSSQLHLHAYKIAFSLDKKYHQFEAPLPKHICASLDFLQLQS